MAATGFQVDYLSYEELTSDHDSFIAHGGLLVPCDEESLPEMNTRCLIRVRAPGQKQSFDLPARVVHHIDGQGFMVTFEPEAEAAKSELTKFVASDEVIQGRETEPKAPENAIMKEVAEFELDGPVVRPVPPPKRKQKYLQLKLADEEEPPAPTQDEPFEEATPVDEAPVQAVAKEAKGPRGKRPPATTGKEPTRMKAAIAPDGEEIIFRTPDPNELYSVIVIKYPALSQFMDIKDSFLETKCINLPLDRTQDELSGRYKAVSSKRGDPAKLRVVLPGKNQFDMYAVVVESDDEHTTVMVEDSDPNFNNLINFPGTIRGRKRLAVEKEAHRVAIKCYRFNEERNVEEEKEKEAMPLRRRIGRMSMEEKINLAQSGDREARTALAMDTNKMIPHYLLRNARITIDEVANMARMGSMNPDILKKISENPAYCQNKNVVKNLVYNPRTPIDVSVRLLDRLPKMDLINLSKKTSMNQRIVQKAKMKLLKMGG